MLENLRGTDKEDTDEHGIGLGTNAYRGGCLILTPSRVKKGGVFAKKHVDGARCDILGYCVSCFGTLLAAKFGFQKRG